MYAIIKTGGKQYKVKEGDRLKVEKLAGVEGETIDFNEVLLVGEGEAIKAGNPYLAGSKVSAQIQGQGRAKKIRIVKHRRRKHYHREMGHRQYYTEVRITSIQAGA